LKNKLKILIAEDDSDEIEFLEEGFMNSGDLFEVTNVVRNGQELIDLIKTMDKAQWPDVILADFNMPMLNGLEALVEFKKFDFYSHIKFVFYSTTSHPATIAKCMDAGGYAYLQKPSSFFSYTDFVHSLYEKVVAQN
jgi:CheY-like chemotaxis protein